MDLYERFWAYKSGKYNTNSRGGKGLKWYKRQILFLEEVWVGPFYDE